MLRLLYSCDCGANDDVEDIENLDGCCPICHAHHGEVQYFSAMTSEEFIEELSKMTEHDICKYATAIKICAEDINENKL